MLNPTKAVGAQGKQSNQTKTNDFTILFDT